VSIDRSKIRCGLSQAQARSCCPLSLQRHGQNGFTDNFRDWLSAPEVGQFVDQTIKLLLTPLLKRLYHELRRGAGKLMGLFSP
jgi:hypothetical protein